MLRRHRDRIGGREVLFLVLALAAFAGNARPAAGESRWLDVAGTPATGVIAGEGEVRWSSHIHRNWFPATGMDSSLVYTAVVEVGDRYLVAAADGSIWRSLDGPGSQFERRTQLAGAPRAMAIAGSGILAVGDFGRIFLSADQLGSTWTEPASPALTDLRGVATNSLSSVAVGDGGTIVRGTPFGAEWVAVDIDETRDFHDVAVIYTQQYLAVGAAGAMWLGQSDGLTWAPLVSPETITFRGVAAAGVSIVIVGDGGRIYTSPGNVELWDLASTPTTADLNAVVFTGNDLIAVGDRGVVLWSLIGGQWAVPVEESTWGRLKLRYR